MNRSTFKFPAPAQSMQFDGERYTSGVEGPIQREHYHRYLFALRYCVDKNVLDAASGEGYGSFLLGQVARSVVGVETFRRLPPESRPRGYRLEERHHPRRAWLDRGLHLENLD